MNIMKSRVATVAVGAAVLVTLSGVGGAVAGSLITTYDIKDYTIRGVDLRADSVSSSKIKDGGVNTADVKDGSLTRADLAFDVPTATAMDVVRLADTKSSDADNTFSFSCPSGKHLIKGFNGNYAVGYAASGLLGVVESPTLTDTDYGTESGSPADHITVRVTASAATTLGAHVLCG